jgi:hypothetical protein
MVTIMVARISRIDGYHTTEPKLAIKLKWLQLQMFLPRGIKEDFRSKPFTSEL